MFDSAKAVIFPSKGISLFVEGLNPGHCVYGMHPSFCHRSQLQGDGETREQRHFYGVSWTVRLYFMSDQLREMFPSLQNP